MTPRREAEALAGRIRAYWERLGYKPAITVIQQHACASDTDSRLFWVVRSDMVGGRPRSKCPAAPKINPGVKSDSTSRVHALARAGQREKLIESVAPSNRVWRQSESDATWQLGGFAGHRPSLWSINDRHV